MIRVCKVSKNLDKYLNSEEWFVMDYFKNTNSKTYLFCCLADHHDIKGLEISVNYNFKITYHFLNKLVKYD